MALELAKLQTLWTDSLKSEAEIMTKFSEEYDVPWEELDVFRTQVARTERVLRMSVDEQDRLRRERERWWTKLINRFKERLSR